MLIFFKLVACNYTNWLTCMSDIGGVTIKKPNVPLYIKKQVLNG
jgi:hypothetical protein